MAKLVTGGYDGVPLLSPRGLAVSRDSGRVFVSEPSENRVSVFDLASRTLTRIMGRADEQPCSANVSAACVNRPWGIAVNDCRLDLQRNEFLECTHAPYLFVTDSRNNRVLSFQLSTALVSHVAGTAGATLLTAFVSGVHPRRSPLLAPQGIAVIPDSYASGYGPLLVYIAETGAHAIRMVRHNPLRPSDDTIVTLAGTARAPGFSNGGPGSSRLNQPGQLALNPRGTALFIADMSNHALRRLDLATNMLSTIAGTGVRGFSVDGSLALGAAISRPMGVASAANGLLYFSDSGYGVADANGGNSCLRAVTPAGVLVTVAGRCGMSPRAADFSRPISARQASLDEPAQSPSRVPPMTALKILSKSRFSPYATAPFSSRRMATTPSWGTTVLPRKTV